MALCELKSVGKKYPLGETWVQALSGVNLEVHQGEFLALAGPSGSGKTTLLNLVGCLDTASEGEIRMEGQLLEDLSTKALAKLRASQIGFIFQSFNLIPVLTALENVDLSLRLAGLKADRERCQEALHAVGIGELSDRLPSQLSGGQQQRVAIARALVKRPALVIADEPTANLDTATGEAVLDLMSSLNASEGVTFLFSTHDPVVIERVQRVIRLRDGRVVGEDTKSGQLR